MSPTDGKRGLLRRLKGTDVAETPEEKGREQPEPGRDPGSGTPETSESERPVEIVHRYGMDPEELQALSDSLRTDDEFLAPGEALAGRYEILRFLSKGGMGAVYQARDNRFADVHKLVAVKEMISPVRDTVTGRISLETFEREANILASLSHPAIPKVFDYFHHERRVYLVIEYIEGTDLESLLAEIDFALTQEKVVDWALQACDVLSYLHSHKPNPIVFRDMKPSNIMLREDGRIMLIDFGIAKVFQAGKRGTMIGTEGYSPPEQYRGVAEPRGDIYALGATLHHLMTRRDPRKEPPFTFHDHPIRDYNVTVTADFEATIFKALEYEIEDRYASAEEVKRALLKVLAGSARGTESLVYTRALLAQDVPPIWSFNAADEIRATPTVVEGALFFGSYDNNLYCLDAKTGKESWSYTTDGGIVSSPSVWSETAFFGSEDQVLYAVYTRTGRIVWTCPTDGKIRSSPQVEYDHVFFGSDDHHLYAVSGKSGQELWRFAAAGPIRCSPVIAGEIIVFGSDDGTVYALDVQSGESRWQYQVGRALQSSPTVAGDMVFIGSDDRCIYALDLANGWAVWRYRTKGKVISSPLVSENMVWCGSNDHHLYALDARSGVLKWQYGTEGPVVSSPRLAEGAVYVGSVDGHLYSLDAKTGTLLWRFRTDGAITGSPVVSEGIVYIGSTDQTMYALPTKTTE
jgi:outer membrane protein assembly factor BamB/tRNA A-37 threonylcarbamoyl transferase component Bud32